MEPEGVLPRHGLWVSVLRSWPELNYVWPPCIGILTIKYEGWNFNSGNYLFTTDTK